jgi:hypothetical protein
MRREVADPHMTGDRAGTRPSEVDIPPSVEEERWSQLAADLPFEQAAAARKQAENWRNLLGGLTALVATVGFVGGREDLRELEPPWRLATAAALTLGLAAFVSATFCAGAAAYGLLPRRSVPTTGKALRVWSRDTVDRAGRLLARAAVLSLAGVVLVVAGAWVTWLGPAEEPPSGHAVLVEVPGGPMCGELVAWRDGRLLLEVGGNVRDVPAADVTRLEFVERC